MASFNAATAAGRGGCRVFGYRRQAAGRRVGGRSLFPLSLQTKGGDARIILESYGFKESSRLDAAAHYNEGRTLTEARAVSIVIAGFVKNGVVVPNTPLPEGAFVDVHVVNGPINVPPELRAELDAWQLAGAEALESVERL